MYLERIHWNVFGKQIRKIKQFYAYRNLPNLKSEPNTDYDLNQLVNSLVNCEKIRIKSCENQLEPIKLRKLKSLWFVGQSSSMKIQSICDFAFYQCDQIERIDLRENHINSICENAFNFRNQNDKELSINLTDNKLTGDSFTLN